MSGLESLELPSSLKSIHPYLKIANDHDQRDIVISYWCRLYALQAGLKLKKTPEDKTFLIKLMDWLETTKKANHENEAITNDIAAQAHVENYALKLFLFADKNDRASNFSKSVIQAFFTAGLLYDVLSIFGELSEEAAQNKKYSKWKAAYIYNCLKNGETPSPGPAKEEEDESNENVNSTGPDTQPMEPQPMQPLLPTHPMQPMYPSMPLQPTPPINMGTFDFPSVPVGSEDNGKPMGNEEMDEIGGDEDENPETTDPHPYNPAPTPTNPGTISGGSYDIGNLSVSSEGTGGVQLSVEQTGKAQKYIKWAGSALNYDDVPTAITNLKKALQLLSTGEDPA